MHQRSAVNELYDTSKQITASGHQYPSAARQCCTVQGSNVMLPPSITSSAVQYFVDKFPNASVPECLSITSLLSLRS